MLVSAIAAVSAGLFALAIAIATGASLVAGAALTLGAGGMALGAGVLVLVRRGQVAAEKASSDIDFIARRLLRIESRLAESDRRKGGDGDLRGAVAEVSGEIALISGLLRDLAGTVAAHDRVLAEQDVRHEDFHEHVHEDLHDDPPTWREPPAQSRLADFGAPVRHEPPVYEPPEAAPRAPPPRFAPVVEPDIEPEPKPRPQAEPVGRRAAEPFNPPAFEPAPFPVEPTQEPLGAAFDPLFDAPEPAPEPLRDRRMQALVQALREDRIEIHLQPIVNLPQRKTRFYEALPRLRLSEDELVAPDEFLPLLERAGVVAELDGKLAARAAAIARHLVNRGSDAFVTCNLAHGSIATPGFLRALGRILEAYPDVVGRLAFEVAQRSWRTLDAETAGALEHLRQKGAPFVLDRATDLRIDPYGLADRGVRFVKVPGALLLAQLRPGAHGLDVAVGDLAASLARAGIKLVADAIDREEDVPDLIDLDVPLAQGLVFGAPRAVRADLVGGGPPSRGGGGGAEAPGRAAAPAGATAGSAQARPGNGASRTPTAAGQGGTRGQTPAGPPPRLPEPPRIPYRATLRRAG